MYKGIDVRPEGRVALFKLLHSLNTSVPKLVTVSGTTTETRPAPRNAKLSIVVKPSGKLISESLLHPAKERLPKVFKLFGMLIEVKAEQPSNALAPIVVKLSPFIVTVSNAEHLLNAFELMPVNVLGKEIDVNFLHS